MKVVVANPISYNVAPAVQSVPPVAKRPNWLEINRNYAKNGKENTYRLTLNDVSVVKINAKIQGIVLTHMNTGVEFHSRTAWDWFCYRVIKGDISNTTLKTIKNSMTTWPSDLQRIWKFIMTLRKDVKPKPDKMIESAV